MTSFFTLPAGAPVPEGLPTAGAVVLEAEYKRPALENAPCRQYIGGKWWLLHQAVAGYSLLTGEAPDSARMKEILFNTL